MDFFHHEHHQHDEAAPDPADTLVCYIPNMITTNGIWQGDHPLDFSLPLFLLQLVLIVGVTRILVVILKPFRQPRVIAEIIGGVLLGPSVLGRNKNFANAIFPLNSVMVLETIANIGLLFFMFLIGVEMDITMIRQRGKKAMVVAVAGMIIPFIIGAIFSFILHDESAPLSQGTLMMFLGISLSITAFPVLARVLAELKLINTEIGKYAMSSALVNDMFAWILLALAIALADDNGQASLSTVYTLICTTAYILFCIYFVRPTIKDVISRTPEGEPFSDFFICMILTGVMISGFITDALGTHSVMGAFVFGLVIPPGPLAVTLIEKLEDFVSGLLLPLYFAISGLKTDINKFHALTWICLVLIIILASAGKIFGTTIAAMCFQMSTREGITLGLLMNTKGLIEMIMLNIGKDQKILDDETFSVMVVVAIIVTSTITPIVTMVYRPPRKFIPYKKRTIQKSNRDGEFQVLACIHTPQNVPTIINLLDASNPTKKSPICIHVLHLVELTGRATAMLVVHKQTSGGAGAGGAQADSDHIFHAFENFQNQNGSISVHPLTAVSPYPTMHEDVCHLAEDNRVAFLILPFHKQQTVDGGMEATNPALRSVNQNVLVNAPCSVGILVDRGLIGSTRLPNNQIARHIVLLFFGGPDDREAVAYAWRMSEHSNILLTVMRFIAGVENDVEDEGEKQIDEDYLREFRAHTSKEESVVYVERVVNNGEETVAAIREIDCNQDLFIVGRGQGQISPLTAGLTDWSECPELGAIGDLLASSDFASNVSVLVVQQYVNVLGIVQTPQDAGYGAAPPDNMSWSEGSSGYNRIDRRQP